jgi:hypothetical protein
VLYIQSRIITQFLSHTGLLKKTRFPVIRDDIYKRSRRTGEEGASQKKKLDGMAAYVKQLTTSGHESKALLWVEYILAE